MRRALGGSQGAGMPSDTIFQQTEAFTTIEPVYEMTEVAR